MTPSELKAKVEAAGDSHYFDRNSMRGFGDTMSNYGVRSATIRVEYDADGTYLPAGADCECWELYRRRPVKHGLQRSAYFRKDTFTKTFPRTVPHGWTGVHS